MELLVVVAVFVESEAVAAVGIRVFRHDHDGPDDDAGIVNVAGRHDAAAVVEP